MDSSIVDEDYSGVKKSLRIESSSLESSGLAVKGSSMAPTSSIEEATGTDVTNRNPSDLKTADIQVLAASINKNLVMLRALSKQNKTLGTEGENLEQLDELEQMLSQLCTEKAWFCWLCDIYVGGGERKSTESVHSFVLVCKGLNSGTTSWSIKLSIAAQKITDCKGSDTAWELRMLELYIVYLLNGTCAEFIIVCVERIEIFHILVYFAVLFLTQMKYGDRDLRITYTSERNSNMVNYHYRVLSAY